ncbi:MAG: hypothetical protein JNL82_00060 [Myxococcales bacterium]|nr:hypothetical protein [Myxococcales bacterium]
MDPASAPELSEILARAGVQPAAVAELMAWARARSSALIAGLDRDSPLGQSLAPGLAQLVMRRSDDRVGVIPQLPPVIVAPASSPARGEALVEAPSAVDPDEAALDGLDPDATIAVPSPRPAEVDAPGSDEVSRPSSPSRSAPRATARVISRPNLGAAIEAALHGETSGDLEVPAEPATASAYSEDDPTIGGFARFANVRRAPSPSESRAPLTQGFARHAERVAAEPSQFLDVPAPPSFVTSESNTSMRVFGVTGDSERSTSLVVGIPDDDTADVPLPRQRRGSEGLAATASGSLRAARPVSEPTSAAPSPARSLPEGSIELNLAIEDPELSSALHRMIPATGETSSTLTHLPSTHLRPGDSMQQIVPTGEMSLQIPITIEEHGPEDALPPEVAEAELPPVNPRSPRKTPPPPPNKRSGTIATTVVPQPEPPQKRGRGRKKVVELGAPVARPAPRAVTPAPVQARPSRETSKPTSAESSQAAIPNYLRDDDE